MLNILLKHYLEKSQESAQNRKKYSIPNRVSPLKKSNLNVTACSHKCRIEYKGKKKKAFSPWLYSKHEKNNKHSECLCWAMAKDMPVISAVLLHMQSSPVHSSSWPSPFHTAAPALSAVPLTHHLSQIHFPPCRHYHFNIPSTWTALWNRSVPLTVQYSSLNSSFPLLPPQSFTRSSRNSSKNYLTVLLFLTSSENAM